MGVRLGLFVFSVACVGCGSSADLAGQSSALEPTTEPAFTALSQTSREQLERSPVTPLLFPERYADATVVTTGPRWYAASYHEDGEITLSIHATDVVHSRLSERDAERITPEFHEVRGEPARATVNEGIRAITWTHEGVAYALEVECWQPFSDDRCTEPYWALDLADELVEVTQ